MPAGQPVERSVEDEADQAEEALGLAGNRLGLAGGPLAVEQAAGE